MSRTSKSDTVPNVEAPFGSIYIYVSSEVGGDTLHKLNAGLSGHEVDTTRSQMITQRSMVIELGRVPWLGQGNFQIR